jgi:hypothetical protein
MDDELYVALDAKVTTTSNNNPTIAPPIAWRGLQYVSAETVPMAAGQCTMSALGQKQTCAPQKVMFALPPKADMCGSNRCPPKTKSRNDPLAGARYFTLSQINMFTLIFPSV